MGGGLLPLLFCSEHMSPNKESTPVPGDRWPLLKAFGEHSLVTAFGWENITRAVGDASEQRQGSVTYRQAHGINQKGEMANEQTLHWGTSKLLETSHQLSSRGGGGM